jgi:hypothetical protein
VESRAEGFVPGFKAVVLPPSRVFFFHFLLAVESLRAPPLPLHRSRATTLQLCGQPSQSCPWPRSAWLPLLLPPGLTSCATISGRTTMHSSRYVRACVCACVLVLRACVRACVCTAHCSVQVNVWLWSATCVSTCSDFGVPLGTAQDVCMHNICALLRPGECITVECNMCVSFCNYIGAHN